MSPTLWPGCAAFGHVAVAVVAVLRVRNEMTSEQPA
jgi:hypothetical protein